MAAKYTNWITMTKRVALTGILSLVVTWNSTNVALGQHDLGGLSKKIPHSLEQTWKLGGKIGLAASAYSFMNGPDDPRMKLVEAELAQAKSMAKLLKVELPDLPEFQNEKSKFAASVVHYMLKQLIETTGNQLQDDYNDRHGVMFELAVKSYALSITYHPEIDDRITFAKMIADRSGKAGFSEKMYKPLVDALNNQKPYDEVKLQLIQFHKDVASNLKFQREMGLLQSASPKWTNYSMPKGFEVPGTMPSFMKSGS